MLTVQVRHPPWHAAPPVIGDDVDEEDEEAVARRKRFVVSLTHAHTHTHTHTHTLQTLHTQHSALIVLYMTPRIFSTVRTEEEIRALFRVIAHEAGPDRKPPNLYVINSYL